MLIDENGNLAGWDTICKLAYDGIRDYVHNADSLCELLELRIAVEDVRFMCREEYLKLNKRDEFGKINTELMKIFDEKENEFKSGSLSL